MNFIHAQMTVFGWHCGSLKHGCQSYFLSLLKVFEAYLSYTGLARNFISASFIFPIECEPKIYAIWNFVIVHIYKFYCEACGIPWLRMRQPPFL